VQAGSNLQSLLETELSEENVKLSQSPLGNLRKKHHVLTPRQSERNLGIGELSMAPGKMRKSTRFQIGGIGEQAGLKELHVSFATHRERTVYHQMFPDAFQSIGSERITVAPILPIAMKTASRPQTAALLGNTVSITVIIAAHREQAAGKSSVCSLLLVIAR